MLQPSEVVFLCNAYLGSDPCYDVSWLEAGTVEDQAYKQDLCGFLHSFDANGAWQGGQAASGVQLYDRIITEIVPASRSGTNMMWKCQGDGTVDGAHCDSDQGLPLGFVYPTWIAGFPGSSGAAPQYQCVSYSYWFGNRGYDYSRTAWSLMARDDPCSKGQWPEGKAICTYDDYKFWVDCHPLTGCPYRYSVYYNNPDKIVKWHNGAYEDRCIGQVRPAPNRASWNLSREFGGPGCNIPLDGTAAVPGQVRRNSIEKSYLDANAAASRFTFPSACQGLRECDVLAASSASSTGAVWPSLVQYACTESSAATSLPGAVGESWYRMFTVAFPDCHLHTVAAKMPQAVYS